MWKGYMPVKCVHRNRVDNFITEPKSKPQATGLLELPGIVKPLDHPDASISSMGETTKEKLEILLVKLREWSRKAVKHLISYNEVAK